jgi:hypothetical protein
MCAWAHTTLGYDGLCFHNPLLEVPTGDLSLSTEELEALAAERYIKTRARKNKDRKILESETSEQKTYYCGVCDVNSTNKANYQTPHRAGSPQER